MSLLLAALKKSEEGGANPHGRAELQLEEVQKSPLGLAGANENLPESESSKIVPPLDTPSNVHVIRAEGKNLFAAKTVLKNRIKLGIVPITLILAGVCAVAGSVYVYSQIKQPRQLNSALSFKAPAPSRVMLPAVVAASAPVLLPLIPISEVPASVAKIKVPIIAEQATKVVKTNSTTLNIRHQSEFDSIDAMLVRAYQAYQARDYVTAGQGYREALVQNPQSRDALLGLAAIAQQQGQDAVALQYFHRVLQLDPRDPVAQAGLASLSAGDASSKENSLKQLISQQPDSATLNFALGNQYAEQSRWAEAQQSYFNALAIEPANALFAFNLAISLDHLGQRNPAAQYYRQCLQLDISGNSGFSREQVQKRLGQLGSH